MPPRKKYTSEQMAKAIEAVDAGEKYLTAAKTYGVPRATLQNKVLGKSPRVCTMGPKTYLTKDEEYLLEQWVIVMSDKHMPVTKDQLLDSVQKIITDKGIKTPFVNNRPGNKWYQLFLRRHPVVAERTAQNLTTARNNVTEKAIENWFEEVGNYLEEKGIKEVLEEPERVFNADESAFYLSPKAGKVLAKKGDKHVYSSSGDEKDNLTVLITGNAAGQFAPPMVVFNYERIPSSVSKKFPDDFAIGRSQTGWMCGSTFYEFMTNVFDPWIEKQNIKKPILFFLDGHQSHLTLHLSNFCAEHGIEIISLNPNSTHILQPMDVAVFRPLKAAWKKAVFDWKLQNNGQNMKKEDFGPVLKVALQNITAECLRNGFRAGGLCPFGSEYIDMTKIKTTPENKQKHDQLVQQQFLQKIELEIQTKLGHEKLQHFKELYYISRDKLNDRLPNEDASLYIIWASTKQSIDDQNCGNLLTEVTASASRIENQNVTAEVILPETDTRRGTGNQDVLDQSRSHTFDSSLQTASDKMPLHLIDHSYPKTPLKDNSTTQDIAISSPSILEPFNSEQNNKMVESETKKASTEAKSNDLRSSSCTIQKTPVTTEHTMMQHIRTPSVLLGAQEIIGPETHKTPVKGNCIVAAAELEASSCVDPDSERTKSSTIQHAEYLTGSVRVLDTNKTLETQKSFLRIGGCIVPSPFKRNLYWPGEENASKGKKRKTKEKLPFAVTSQAWREYHEKKEAVKRQKIEEKEKRAKERELNKLSKDKLKQEKQMKKLNFKGKNLKNVKITKSHDTSNTDTDTDTEVQYCESDDSPYEVEEEEETFANYKGKGKGKKQDGPESICQGNYVIVRYEGEYFPGVVERVGKETKTKNYEISTMTFSTGRTFKWPEKPDKIWYKEKDIVQIIAPPVLSNKRGFYTVEEMEKHLSFTI